MNSKTTRVFGSAGIGLMLLLAIGCSDNTGENVATSSASPSPLPTASSASPSATESPSASAPESSPTASPSAPAEANEIDKMIGSMSLEQKIGQMILAGVEGTSLDDSAKKMISEQYVGGVILYKNNFSDLEGSVRFVNDLKKANFRNPAPLFVSVDQEGGKVSRLPKDFVAIPDAAKVGKTGKPELAEQMGALLAEELNLMGFNVDFAPVLDINSNPKNPVIGTRSFGNKADLVTKMGLR